MAEVSAQNADLTILTAEDPRTESLEEILAEMAAGMMKKGGVEGENYWCVPDRGNAIRFALDLAQPGDIVMVFGKGHEQSMCFGEIEYPWDDRTALSSSCGSSGHSRTRNAVPAYTGLILTTYLGGNNYRQKYY